MFKLIVLCLAASIAVVYGFRCHVSNDENNLHCGAVNNMTCASSDFMPFCHKISGNNGDADQLNGVCSCEQFCFTVDDCPDNCWHSHPICHDAYASSIERICVCVRN